MSGCHLALVVDDDKYILEEVKSMLVSMGHECRLARTQEEAQALFEAQSFCYVVLDLELKLNSKSAKANKQTGFNILDHIRKIDEELPVIIMTAHGREHELSVHAFKKGATDYIKKPFDQDTEPLEDKIREAMSKTCESAYETCPNVAGGKKRKPAQRKAKPAAGKPSKGPRFATNDSFRLTGACKKRKYSVEINGKEALIPLQSFQLLCRLAFKLKEDKTGWLHTSEMDVAGNVHQAIKRLKGALSEHLDDPDAAIENDGHGQYRLSVPPGNVSIDKESIKTYHHHLHKFLP